MTEQIKNCPGCPDPWGCDMCAFNEDLAKGAMEDLAKRHPDACPICDGTGCDCIEDYR